VMVFSLNCLLDAKIMTKNILFCRMATVKYNTAC
jgi:hypothetical protein